MSQYDARNIRTHFAEFALQLNPAAPFQPDVTPDVVTFSMDEIKRELSYDKETKFRSGVSIGLDSYFLGHDESFAEADRRPVFIQVAEIQQFSTSSRYAFVLTNDSSTNLSGTASYTVGGHSELPAQLTLKAGLLNLQDLRDTTLYNLNGTALLPGQPSQRVTTVVIRLYITCSFEPNVSSIDVTNPVLVAGAQAAAAMRGRGVGESYRRSAFVTELLQTQAASAAGSALDDQMDLGDIPPAADGAGAAVGGAGAAAGGEVSVEEYFNALKETRPGLVEGVQLRKAIAVLIASGVTVSKVNQEFPGISTGSKLAFQILKGGGPKFVEENKKPDISKQDLLYVPPPPPLEDLPATGAGEPAPTPGLEPDV